MKNTNKLLMGISILTMVLSPLHELKGQMATSWPAVNSEMRPGTRWWWMGNAVDKANLSHNLKEYARVGLGSVEITPIYGVKNNDANEIEYLSEKWMQMLAFTEAENAKLGILTDMNTGTGWPFGGPQVSIENAASKLLIQQYQVKSQESFHQLIRPDDVKQQKVAHLQKLMAFSGKQVLNLTALLKPDGTLDWKAPEGEWTLIAAFCGKTFQQVKRAAPGGQGYVMDHFSKKAVAAYFDRFTKAFSTSGTPYPHNFFNDSYEVFEADWTPDFFAQFEKRRGYKLENYLQTFLSTERTDEPARLVADYRETISDLLLENFTRQWTNWAHTHGSKTRNQAHGSPGNLIDLYATVDVPECEGFGLSDFGIKGLRKDSLTRKNDSELSMLKYASSAAHIAGKPYTSSETFTWLTEHFRTSLSQCKPDLDLMFVAGVNHMNFHGTTYSPGEAAWPGWKFYASIDMSPTNTIWRDAPGLMRYITRCQSFLQTGKPDNDLLVYLPVYDVWHQQKGRLLTFTIHQMDKIMPKFIETIHSIYENGYDVDYISDNFILSAQFVNGKIRTSGGNSYRALILPAVERLPVAVMQHLNQLIASGATVVFLENYPNDVPGFNAAETRRTTLNKMVESMTTNKDFSQTKVTTFRKGRIITGSDYAATLKAIGVQPEEMITRYGLHAIRRSNSEGYHYFISALHNKDMDEWVALSVPARSAVLFDPMTGSTGKASLRQQNGKALVRLQLKSGQSVILKTYTATNVQADDWVYVGNVSQTIDLNGPWKLSFNNSAPDIKSVFTLTALQSWTTLANDTLKINGGTGVYETTLALDNVQSNAVYLLQLGDVRESAHVWVNGQDAGIVWAAPFECRIGHWLKKGLNTLRIEVTNLPANRIADYDRRKTGWRNFKEINFVDRNYKATGYAHWQPMESGLCSPVRIEVYSR